MFIKVNQYDPENIQKGRLMLLNIGEELKSYAKVKIAPEATTKFEGEQKPKDKGISKAALDPV